MKKKIGIVLFVVFVENFCFELLDYNVTAIQTDGPFTCPGAKYTNVSFNMGVAVPNATLSGQDDCIILFYEAMAYKWTCYGKISKTTYSGLSDGSDGVLMTSKNQGEIVSWISFLCNPNFTKSVVTNCLYSQDINLTATVSSPSACVGTGPGKPPEAKKNKNSNGKFGIAVLIVLLISIVLFFVGGGIYAFFQNKKTGGSMIGFYGVFICYLPGLIKDGVSLLFSSFMGSKSQYSHV